jgi:hypothetical protein
VDHLTRVTGIAKALLGDAEWLHFIEVNVNASRPADRIASLRRRAAEDAAESCFRPPSVRTPRADRDLDLYSKAYWDEFDRLRFERGEYDLL